MKKILLTLCLTVMMIFAFSITCLAAGSPTGTVKPTKDERTSGGGTGKVTTGEPNTSDKSPQTGSFEIGGSLIVTFTALGIAIVSMKKFSECK